MPGALQKRPRRGCGLFKSCVGRRILYYEEKYMRSNPMFTNIYRLDGPRTKGVRSYARTPLREVRVSELLDMAKRDPIPTSIAYRAKSVSVRFDHVIMRESHREFTAVFKARGEHENYWVYISFPNFWPIYNERGDEASAIRYCIEYDTDVEVYCDCPSFTMWGYAYIAGQKGYNYRFKRRETRPPNERNPYKLGSVCKHLWVVLKTLPRYESNIIDATIRGIGKFE